MTKSMSIKIAFSPEGADALYRGAINSMGLLERMLMSLLPPELMTGRFELSGRTLEFSRIDVDPWGITVWAGVLNPKTGRVGRKDAAVVQADTVAQFMALMGTATFGEHRQTLNSYWEAA